MSIDDKWIEKYNTNTTSYSSIQEQMISLQESSTPLKSIAITQVIDIQKPVSKPFIRRAKLKDVPQLNTLILGAYSIYQPFFDAYSITYKRSSLASLKHIIQKTNTHFYVYEINSKIVGCIQMDAYDKDASACIIGQFAVDQEYQLLGIGLKLSFYLHARAKMLKYKAIMVVNMPFQKELIKKYETFGFTWEGAIEEYVFHGASRVVFQCKVMTLEL